MLEDKMREAITGSTRWVESAITKERGWQTDEDKAAKACAQIAQDNAIAFAVWAAKDDMPQPFVADAKRELMIDANDTEETIRSKATALYSLFQQSLSSNPTGGISGTK